MLKRILWKAVMAPVLLVAPFTLAVAEPDDQSLTLAPSDYYWASGLTTVTEPTKIDLPSGIGAIDVVVRPRAKRVVLSRLIPDKKLDPTSPRGRADVVEIDASDGRLIRSISRNDSPGQVGLMFRSANEDFVFVVWVGNADETVGLIERIDLRPEVPQTESIIWPPPGANAGCSILRFEPTGDGGGFCVVSDQSDESVRKAITPWARGGPPFDVYTWRTGAGWHLVQSVGHSPAYVGYCRKFSRDVTGSLDDFCQEARKFVYPVAMSKVGHILLLTCDVRNAAGPALLEGLDIDLINQRSTQSFLVPVQAPVREAVPIRPSEGRLAVVLRSVTDRGPWHIFSESGALVGALLPPQGFLARDVLTSPPDGHLVFFFHVNNETGRPTIDLLDIGSRKWLGRLTDRRCDAYIANHRFSFSNTLVALLQRECREKEPDWPWGWGVSNRLVIWNAENCLEQERAFKNSVAEELAKHHDPHSGDLVPGYTNSLEEVGSEPQGREMAARVLGYIGDTRAISQLRKAASEDPDEAVRKAAKEALDRINARG
ncbi:MAG: HEAT repeat domain-containing protein [Planctomycetota bacterium]|nr:HEAT repeat domain-containing protein [Planctomycetota bacterium]